MSKEFLLSFFKLLILLTSNFAYINSIKLNEKYPSTFVLSDGTLFLVTENGFRIYDSSLQIIKSYYNFENSKKITSSSEAESVCISQYSDGTLIILVKNNLYVIKSSYIYTQTLSTMNGRYYNLIDYKYDTSYYYIISYYENGKIHIRYYRFSFEYSFFPMGTKLSYELLKSISYSEEGKQIQEYGVSCQKMKKNNNDVLTCFYEVSFPIQITTTSFSVSESSITAIDMDKKYCSNSNTNVIKSVTSPDKKKALICYTKDNGEGCCIIYDLTSNEFTSQETKYFDKCKGSSLGFNVYYFSQKNEYMFVCNDNNKGFNVVLFNSNFEYNIPYSNTKSEPYYICGGNCYSVNSFNIIKSGNSNDYTIVNDCDIGGQKFLTSNINLNSLADNNNYPMDDDLDIFNSIISTSEKTNIDEEIITNQITNIKTQEVINENPKIITTSSSKSKKEIINNLDELINDKDPDKVYLINGEDYSIIIKPLNERVEESSVRIDFTECEKLLKNQYPSKKFRILQINMENPNDKCLTDQVEYQIYDESGEIVNLSICKDTKIIIEYQIKDTSYLDIEKITDLKQIGIDAFNLEDNFFNNICYSYSDTNSNSDVILSDRVSDLYQNFSICEEECEYAHIDLDSMYSSCNCYVKQEVSAEVKKGNFKSYLLATFLESNFGVIKCYNLVFSLKGKLKNAGFWIFIIMIILHIPIYIFYSIKGISNILQYISNEMDSKGYISNNNLNNIIDNMQLSGSQKNGTPRRNLKRNRSSQTIITLNQNKNNNPPKKQPEYFNTSNNVNNNKIIKTIKFTEIPKTIENETNLEHKNLFNKIGNNKNKNSSPLKINSSKNVIFRKNLILNMPLIQNSIAYHNRKIITKKNNEIIETREMKSKINLENLKNLQKENNEIKEVKKHNQNIHNKKLNIKVNELESCEFLTQNSEIQTKIKIKNKLSKKSIDNLEKIQFTTGDDMKVDSKKVNKKQKREFPLILINANNNANYKPLESDYILNIYDYNEAIKLEYRSFWRIFFICLIAKEKFLNLIFFNPPLQLRPLRICIFIFNCACDFALNALFYLSDNISEKYHYQGSNRELFSLVNNITISLVSTIVTIILLTFLRSLTQSEKKTQKLFREQENLLNENKKYKVEDETKLKIKNEILKIIKCLKIKIICFLIFEILLMLFFLYYVTAFCHVYYNTQLSWFLDSIVSYAISLLISLLLSFICTIIYEISNKYKLKKLYKIITFIYCFV